jgi:hypothetical protein
MIEHEYVTVKLVNGDNIIAVMISEEDDYFILMYPVQMKTSRIDTKEILVGTPWSPFTDEKIFNVFKQDVIMMQPLNNSTIAYYKNLIDVTAIEIPELEEEEEISSDISDKYFFIVGNNTSN